LLAAGSGLVSWIGDSFQAREPIHARR